MHSLTWNGYQKLWNFIDQSTVHVTLHLKEKMMIVALHLNRLVD